MTLATRPDPSLCASISFRPARAGDGADLWRLVQAIGTLELNSPYFYLLWATEFAGTCLVAEQAGKPVGLVLGFHPPERKDAAFVWQVGVTPEQRGTGLALRMLKAWMALPANQGRRWVLASVATDNTASQSLFRRLAESEGCRCESQPYFTADQFPVDHPAEPLLRVGPFSRAQENPV